MGCTAFRFTRGGSILGVQLEALDGSARRLDRRWRRCIGTKSGAVFEIGPILGVPALAVRIVEGEASALAAALAWPRQLIRATGGTSGFRIEALEGLPGGLAAILDGLGHRLDVAVNIEVPISEVTARLLARGRSDDTLEAIQRRLELYEEQTAPLRDWFEARGLLATVDGVGPPDEVFERVAAAVERSRG